LLRLFTNRVLCLSFSAYKKNCLAFVFSDQIGDKRDRLAKHSLSLLQVDDVNAIALAKDVFLHLWVPAPYLVAEVNAGLQQLFHGNRYQTKVSFSLIGLMYSPQPLDFFSVSNQSCHGNGLKLFPIFNCQLQFGNRHLAMISISSKTGTVSSRPFARTSYVP